MAGWMMDNNCTRARRDNRPITAAACDPACCLEIAVQ